MRMIAAVALIAMVSIGAAHIGVSAPRHAPRTVWDSVYTEEQARRGETLFKNTCARCHDETLKGIDDAPPLAGSAFLSGWDGKPLSSLFERINSSMPSDDPGTLTKAQIADLIAYILRYGAFPAGAAELPPDAAPMAEIKIIAAKPSP
jgi:mono/diheme cytochrome c family protein